MEVEAWMAAMRAEVAQWLPRLAAAAGALVVAWLAAGVAQRALLAVLKRGRFAASHQAFFSGVARWLVIGVGLAAALDAIGLGSLATGLFAGGGVTAVVLGFAFREIGENLLAGVLLAFSRPFDLGDYVASGGIEGNVRGVDLRTVHVRTTDGRDVWIPNAQIVNQPFENYTVDGLRRPAFEVGLDYGDDAEAACACIRVAVEALPDVLDAPGPQVVLVGLDGAWVTLRVAFWVDVPKAGRPLVEVTSDAIDAARRALRAQGHTLSCDTTTAIALHPSGDLQVRMAP